MSISKKTFQTRVLLECSLEPYMKKIECYLTSLELIADTKNDQSREKAQELLELYKQASTDGTINSLNTINGVNGNITGDAFNIKLVPRMNNQEENDNKVQKRLRINDYFAVHATTPQREQYQQENQNLNNLSPESSNNNISKKPQNGRSILESADSKMNQGNHNFKCEGPINKDNEDTFVHNTLHDLINEIFRESESILELVWANSESSSSKIRHSSNKENDIVKGNKPDFKILTNNKDEILFSEVKTKDSSSILVKKDFIKLAEFQAGTLDELITKYGNKIGTISFGIWVCGAHVRIYEMDLNYDGVYRMILVTNVSFPTEREKIINLVPFLEAFYNIKVNRISEVSTVIASPNSPSRSTYGRMPIPSPNLVKIAITGLRSN
ncbi:3403_t:CDS:2 [Diversispora eburnea]|uniref:3403_t:CDS:1 n=1 Tax=Diversispora eburnea TaxID=1213867 RepID=A0A9N8WJ93_9GLOM|nr:3403_t:CDS:2 [Diversispora eburnea]